MRTKSAGKRERDRRSIRFIGGIFHSKYIEIILAVSLFVLLDAGILIINFYTSYQIANDAHAIQLASRMGTLSQSLLHELYQVHEDAGNPDVDYMKTIDVFATSYKLFDESLDAFLYGGELIGQGQGQDGLLNDTVYRDTNSHLLKDAEEIWKVFRVKLKPVVYAYYNDVEREEVIGAAAVAIAYARQQSGTLLDLMQSFAGAVEGVAQRKAERLRSIQSLGISLAVINFFLILFHFLKRLRRSDVLVEKSRKETEDILENVNEGLFLLDREYLIGSQHSQSLHGFFKNDNLAGQNFIDLLRPLVTGKTLETVEEYTEILFSPRVNESLIRDLNPLKQVEVHLASDDASYDIRNFSFQFSRVYEKNEFNTLLVTVKDISEVVHLSDQLKAANEKINREIDMLLAIIHVDNSMLTDFLRASEEGLNKVNNILKEKERGSDGLRRKLETISRVIHKLKGDSTILKLEFVMEKFHRFELAIKALKDKQNITGQDFLPLVVHLNQLMTDFNLIRNLGEKMSGIELLPVATEPASSKNGKAVAALAPGTTETRWKNQMSNLVEQIAADYEKLVALDMSGFDASLLSERQREPVKDIIVQSLRNSIAHGLERPDVRERAGKSREGHLKLTLSKIGTGLQLMIRDDGQGVDLEKIKSTAISNGLVAESQLRQWQPAKVVSLIFRHGFTTVQQSGLHAGQGVGMDLAKARLDSLNGRVRVRFQAGSYTEFLYSFESEIPVAGYDQDQDQGIESLVQPIPAGAY